VTGLRVWVSMVQPMFFERPEGTAVTLRSTPRLANWNRSGDTGGARLTRALAFTEHLTDPLLAAADGPVALRFDVGLPRAARLLDERDLDNYLLPLTAHLAGRSPQPIVSVWGCKRYADETSLRVEAARPRPDEPEGAVTMTLRLHAAGARDDFKAAFRKEIRELVAARLDGVEPLPDGPVVLEASFVVGPRRSWLDLWWSTIDGLGPLLGQSPAQPEFHPRDSRIIDLGLHCAVDPALDTEVVIALRARSGWLEPAPRL
jgi:hypothetical protein